MADIVLKSWNIRMLKMYSPCWNSTIHSSARAGRTNSSRSNFSLVSNLLHTASICPVLPNISSLACQTPPKATALCQKWQGSRLALRLLLWTPKPQRDTQTSGAGRSECSTCFSTLKNILMAVLSWEAVFSRFMFLESSQAALLAQHIHRYGRPLEDRKVLSASNLFWPLLSTNKSQWNCAHGKEALIMQRLWHRQIFTDTDEFLK